MRKLKEFYNKYKDYIAPDMWMYIIMFGGIIIFFGLAFIFGWL